MGMVVFHIELCSVWFSSYARRASGFLHRLGRETTTMVILSTPSAFLWLPQITLAALILFFYYLDSLKDKSFKASRAFGNKSRYANDN